MSNARLHRVASVASAAAAAGASWAVTTQLIGVRLAVQLPHTATSTIGLGRTVAAAGVAAIAAWGALALAERWVVHPRRSWLTAAVVVLIASFALPIGFATSTASALGLIAIHLSVAVTTLASIAPSAPAHPHRAAPDADPTGLLHPAA